MHQWMLNTFGLWRTWSHFDAVSLSGISIVFYFSQLQLLSFNNPTIFYYLQFHPNYTANLSVFISLVKLSKMHNCIPLPSTFSVFLSEGREISRSFIISQHYTPLFLCASFNQRSLTLAPELEYSYVIFCYQVILQVSHH